MSDATDGLSVKLGTALLDELGVSRTKPAPINQGAGLERGVIAALELARPDLTIDGSTTVTVFAQYRHLDVLPTFLREYAETRGVADRIAALVNRLPPGPSKTELLTLNAHLAKAMDINTGFVDRLRRDNPKESMLNVDVTVAVPAIGDEPEEMVVGLSAKWSLRTDRAQDCISQGGRLVTLRRGRMPHYAVVTIEPRPAMLRILADGSGSIDCVYHLDLPALRAAIDKTAGVRRRPEWATTFDRLVEQRRLRDFDDLVSEMRRLPSP